MQFRTIKEVKGELKRLRKRQDTHQYDASISRKKNQLRSLLWRLLRQTPYSRKAAKREKPEKTQEQERTGKTKRSSSYT
jgi:hypothetical protein